MITPGGLDNPVLASLVGAHAHLAQVRGRARRFPPEVADHAALPDDPNQEAWADLADLAGPGGHVLLVGDRREPPPGWSTVIAVPGVQLVHSTVDKTEPPSDEVVQLGPADQAELLDLVKRTDPGPFRPRATQLGAYVGVRRDGALVAAAGERLRPAGWTEISAVCTDPAYRGQGLATMLVGALVAGIRARGETPFLHVAVSNTNARRLYENLGFTLRREVVFHVLTAPS